MKKLGYAKLQTEEQLLHALHSLLHLVKVYEANNQLVGNCVQQLLDLSAQLMKGDAGLALMLENGRFYLNEHKILRRWGSVEHILDNLYAFLVARRIHGLQLQAGLLVARQEELVKFARLLNECGEQPEPSVWLAQQLEVTGIKWVEVQGSTDEAESEVSDSRAERLEKPGHRSPRKVYAHTLRSLQDVARKISVNKRVGMRKAVRMVHIMIEEVLLQEEEQLLLAMSTIRAYDDYTFTHSVNVAILCLYIGRQLGLSKETMEYLGVCGLFHDLGKVMIPYEVLNKEAPLSPEEFAEIRQHSLNSTRLIVQLLAAPASRKARIMVPPFEHHLNYNLSGYPALGWDRPISLCGRILAIADVYDALTSPRVYRKEAMSADRALALMSQGSGTVFDPLLLKTFIRMLGVYPIGTMLELDSGELALVSRTPGIEDLNRPWVTILKSDGHGEYRRGPEINLSERDELGAYRRRIVKSSHPSTRNIQPAQFLT